MEKKRSFPDGGKDNWKGPQVGTGWAELRHHGSPVWLHTVRAGIRGVNKGCARKPGTKHSGLGMFVCMEIGMGSVKQGGSYDPIHGLERSLRPSCRERTVPGRCWEQETGREAAAEAKLTLVIRSRSSKTSPQSQPAAATQKHGN